MATAVSIASSALVLIGHPSISSFTEPGAGAQAAASLYEDTLRDTLTEHSWRFSMRKQTLSRLIAEPLNQYKYQFQLPSDFLAVQTTRPIMNYEIFQDKLLANEKDIDLDYWFRPGEWAFPTYFIKALQYRLAAEFAQSVTQKKELADQYIKMYFTQLARAKSRDSQNRTNVAIADNPFVQVRY